MGWSSANPIFDRTARAMIDAGVADGPMTAVLAVLIDALKDHDWDSLYESMEEFQDNPAVMDAFRQAIPDYFEDDE